LLLFLLLELGITCIRGHKEDEIIFNLGFSKAGTTSVQKYLQCIGILNVSHYQCIERLPSTNPSAFCASCVQEVVKHHKNLNETCGFYNAYAEFFLARESYDHNGYDCAFSQIIYFKKLYTMYPNASFLLPIRPIDDTINSMRNWLMHDSVPYDESISICIKKEKSLGDRYDYNKSNTILIKSLWEMHTQNVRAFFKGKENFLEFDIYDPNAENILNFFFHEIITKQKTKKSCWSQENINNALHDGINVTHVSQQVGQQYEKYKLAICAVFANEDHRIEEWLNFHISAGVEKFFLYHADDHFDQDRWRDIYGLMFIEAMSS